MMIEKNAQEKIIMAKKLYFKYGTMGSSKTAQALITKFNYEEKGMRVWLIKPQLDKRDGEDILRSRVGLSCRAYVVGQDEDLWQTFNALHEKVDVIIADEAQFFSAKQVEALRDIVSFRDVPVLCFGLRTDFRTETFEGSKRLLELADTIEEIKTICACGAKATVNARVDANGRVITEGEQIMLGGNECYEAMCYKCWRRRIAQSSSEKL